MTFGFTVGSRKAAGRQDWKQYYDNSLLADGPELRQLMDKARALGIYLSMAIPSVTPSPARCTTPT